MAFEPTSVMNDNDILHDLFFGEGLNKEQICQAGSNSSASISNDESICQSLKY
jgi:hypothetical protein